MRSPCFHLPASRPDLRPRKPCSRSSRIFSRCSGVSTSRKSRRWSIRAFIPAACRAPISWMVRSIAARSGSAAPSSSSSSSCLVSRSARRRIALLRRLQAQLPKAVGLVFSQTQLAVRPLAAHHPCRVGTTPTHEAPLPGPKPVAMLGWTAVSARSETIVRVQTRGYSRGDRRVCQARDYSRVQTGGMSASGGPTLDCTGDRAGMALPAVSSRDLEPRQEAGVGLPVLPRKGHQPARVLEPPPKQGTALRKSQKVVSPTVLSTFNLLYACLYLL